jgi:hypothetical protein
MLGMCADPVTGAPLGRLPNHATHEPAHGEKGLDRSSAGDSDGPLSGSEEADEAVRRSTPKLVRAPVVGFDLTFSPSRIHLVGVGRGRPGHQGGALRLSPPGDPQGARCWPISGSTSQPLRRPGAPLPIPAWIGANADLTLPVPSVPHSWSVRSSLAG